MKKRIEEYGAWVESHGPSITVSEAESARSLMERGYTAWKAEQKRSRARVS